MESWVLVGLFCVVIVAVAVFGLVHDTRAAKRRQSRLLADDRTRARAEEAVRYYRDVGDSSNS